MTKITPPALARLRGWHILFDDGSVITAAGVVAEIASGRFKAAIIADVQRDLLRFAASRSTRIHVGLRDGRAFFAFDRIMVDHWLSDGGRDWIVAELESRSGSQVIAFPKKGGVR